MRAKIMKITYTDSGDGMVLIGFTDERGEHEIALSTIETADLIGALRTSLEEAVGSPAANRMGLPGIERVQIVETAEEVFFRVYMNDRISHDYPVPKGTVLADELRMMATGCAQFGKGHTAVSGISRLWDTGLVHTTSSGLREVPDFIELMSLARQSLLLRQIGRQSNCRTGCGTTRAILAEAYGSPYYRRPAASHASCRRESTTCKPRCE